MLILNKKTTDKLFSHARSEYPKECCGILLGRRLGEQRIASAAIPTRNMADEAQTQFLINPLEIVRAEKTAELQNLEVVGFYHSHPDYEAIVSQAGVLHMIAGYSYLIISVKNGIHIRAHSFEKQIHRDMDAKSGPCLRCQFPAPPPAGLVPTCAEGGVISPLPGIIGSAQANEVLKLLVGGGESLAGKLLMVDTWRLRTSILPVHKDENCLVCGKHPSILEVENFDYEDFCGLKQDEYEIPVEGIDAEELAIRIENGDPMTIVDVREPHERAIQRFPNAIIIPIGQLARRQKELDPDVDTIFICKEGKRSILAINTLREAGYKGPMYNLKGGIESAKNIIFSNEAGWL